MPFLGRNIAEKRSIVKDERPNPPLHNVKCINMDRKKGEFIIIIIIIIIILLTYLLQLGFHPVAVVLH